MGASAELGSFSLLSMKCLITLADKVNPSQSVYLSSSRVRGNVDHQISCMMVSCRQISGDDCKLAAHHNQGRSDCNKTIENISPETA